MTPTSRAAGAASPRYRFFGGKGGVGKTTCAAGFALASAARGGRVLLVSTDPAHSLAHAFGRTSRAKARGGASFRVAAGKGRLDVVELDADAALGRFVGERRSALRQIVARGTYLDDEDIDAFLGLAFPGVDELVGLVELTRLAEAGAYPEVVVDTAPTGHTLRLLGMPATLERVAGALETMQAKHHYLSESLAGRRRPDGGDAVIDEIAARARALDATLRDPARAAFSWVTLPEPVAMEEARDGVGALDAAGIAIAELIVNRATPRPDARCAVCEARAAAEAPIVAGARSAFPGVAVRVLEDAGAEPRGTRALLRVGRHLLRRGESARARGARARPPKPTARSAPPARPVDLDVLAPPGVRLVLFAGKGGVGKTTCAAAVGIALADRGPDGGVLLLSTDPAHSLGDVLGAALDDVPRPVSGGPRGLLARELDAGALYRDRRARYLDAVDRVFAELRGSSRFDLTFDRAVLRDLLDLAPPGIDELLGLLAIASALATGDGPPPSRIVVDTAPTGHVLRLLAMPALGLEWVHTLMALLLKYRQVVGLGQFGEDLIELSRELRDLQRLLTDRDRARVVAVARATEASRFETARLLDGLGALGVAVSAVVVNALTPPGCPRCRRVHARERRTLGALARGVRAAVKGPCAIIGAPVAVPPPRGAAALRPWRTTWALLDA